jgi:hypothetical protein
MYTIASRSWCRGWILSDTEPGIDGSRTASIIVGSLGLARCPTLAKRYLRKHTQHRVSPVFRQRLPNRLTGIAHRVIPATGPAREAPPDPVSAIQSSRSNYQRHHEWDIEQAFRCIKTVDLQVRPVRHWLADRVRAHVFLCMLAYYLEWHMRQRLAPMLFDDTDKQAAEALRESVVAQAQRSPAAVTKQTTGLTADGLPVHSFRSLLADLATLARNTITTAITPDYPLTVVTRPTAIQHKAFELLGLRCSQ